MRTLFLYQIYSLIILLMLIRFGGLTTRYVYNKVDGSIITTHWLDQNDRVFMIEPLVSSLSFQSWEEKRQLSELAIRCFYNRMLQIKTVFHTVDFSVPSHRINVIHWNVSVFKKSAVCLAGMRYRICCSVISFMNLREKTLWRWPWRLGALQKTQQATDGSYSSLQLSYF